MALYSGPQTFTNPDLCTLQTCSLDEANFTYIPTLAGNSLYAGIFGVLVLSQIFLGIRYRTWGFMAGMFSGITLEIIRGTSGSNFGVEGSRGVQKRVEGSKCI